MAMGQMVSDYSAQSSASVWFYKEKEGKCVTNLP